jgi:hypothetical protein
VVPSINKAETNVRQVRRKVPKTLNKTGLSELYQLRKLAWFKKICIWLAMRRHPRPSANLAVDVGFLAQVPS